MTPKEDKILDKVLELKTALIRKRVFLLDRLFIWNRGAKLKEIEGFLDLADAVQYEVLRDEKLENLMEDLEERMKKSDEMIEKYKNLVQE